MLVSHSDCCTIVCSVCPVAVCRSSSSGTLGSLTTSPTGALSEPVEVNASPALHGQPIMPHLRQPITVFGLGMYDQHLHLQSIPIADSDMSWGLGEITYFVQYFQFYAWLRTWNILNRVCSFDNFVTRLSKIKYVFSVIVHTIFCDFYPSPSRLGFVRIFFV